MINKGNIPSSDNIHILHYISTDTAEPKCVMLIVHGMSEFKERYEQTMLDLDKLGIKCYCYDQLGHGEARISEEENGFFGEENGVKNLLSDVNLMIKLIKEENPGKKVVLLGHSMGSFIVRCYTAQYRDPDMLVLSGTSGGNPGCDAGIALAKVSIKLHGPTYKDKFICALAVGGNSKRFKNEPYAGKAWLCHDLEIKKMMTEKSFVFSAAGMKDMFTMLKYVSSDEWYEHYPKNIPVYLFSGEDDPVGDFGKGFAKVCRGLEKCGANVKYKLYKGGRHEMLNEDNRDEVIADLYSAIVQKLGLK